MKNKQGELVLIVDDEVEARFALEALVADAGYRVHGASNGAEALDWVRDNAPAVVVTDLRMPEMDGMQLLTALRSERPELPVVMVTSVDDLSAAVAAMKAGAEDFLPKPVDVDALLLVLERALQRDALVAEAASLRDSVQGRNEGAVAGLLGTSAPMQEVYRSVRRVAPSRASVLIHGEPGSGKGKLAQAIHQLSPRCDAPFVVVHCAGNADAALELELFGSEVPRRIGKVEQARGGTLFLDEVAELPASVQIKLLRLLQERSFERVGGGEAIQADVRLVASSQRDVQLEVNEGHFREDLYYRLSVVQLEMPPLRLRGGDVLQLAEHFMRRFCEENGRELEGFTRRARTKLSNHRWTGNVRALENCIERAVVMCGASRIDIDDLPLEEATAPLGQLEIPGATLAEAERYVITKTLAAVGGSTARAAEILDVSVRMVQYRLHQYGIERRKR